MDVKFTDGDRDAGRQTKFPCPGGAEGTGGHGCVVGLVVEAVAERGELGVEHRKELLVGKTSPLVAVERLVPGSADATLHREGILHSGQDGGNPVGQLHPGIGGVKDLRCNLQAPPDLAPPPLGGIGVSALGDVAGSVLGSEFGDEGRLFPSRMVFPEPALGMEILFPLGIVSQCTILAVDRDRAGAGGVDTQADDLARRESRLFRGGRKGALHGFLQSQQIVPGLLAGKVVILGVQQNSLGAARVVEDGASVFLAIMTAHHQGAYRVGAVIDADREGG